jgi:hypothetical protein
LGEYSRKKKNLVFFEKIQGLQEISGQVKKRPYAVAYGLLTFLFYPRFFSAVAMRANPSSISARGQAKLKRAKPAPWRPKASPSLSPTLVV